MKGINRWIAKHAWLVYLLPSAVICVGTSVFINDFLGAVVWLLWMLVISLLIARFVFTRGNKLLAEPMSVLQNRCDPYPWIEEIQRQKHYPGNRHLKLQRCVYEAMGLRDIGEYAQAYDLLRSEQQRKLMKAHPANQMLYYVEMYYLAGKLEKRSELENWHAKVVESYEKMELISHRKQMAPTMAAHMAFYYLMQQDYEAYLEEMKLIPSVTLRNQVMHAMNMARYHKAVGKIAEAKEKLQFVIENGNKLYIVTEARELLAKINTEETKE